MKDVRLIVKYSSEQRLISFSKNVSDQRKAINTVFVTFTASQAHDHTLDVVFEVLGFCRHLWQY